MVTLYFLLMAAVAVAAFFKGRSRALGFAAGSGPRHSLPAYHGFFLSLACLLPMLAALLVWSPLASRAVEARAVAAAPAELAPASDLDRQRLLGNVRVAAGLLDQGREPTEPALKASAEAFRTARLLSTVALFALGLGGAALGFTWALKRLSSAFRARNNVEGVVKAVLIACSGVAVLTTVGIVLSVLFESIRFFARYPWDDFLFGTQWSPQTALRADQVGSSGSFGAVPLFAGTTLIMLIAMGVAGPVGLFAAIYTSEYASRRARGVIKPVLEVLAGVPTVVFGFFAALTVAPFIRGSGESIGLDVASESALAAGLVMGVMIIPFVSSLSDDVINAVPQSLRDGSFAMGATRSETITKVVLPAALPGIVSAMMLAVSRAVGETMIVVMAAGLAGNLSFNPLDAVTTVTVQIKTLLVGDQEFDSAKTLSAFALGFVLFFFTLVLNVIALAIVRRYREQYD